MNYARSFFVAYFLIGALALPMSVSIAFANCQQANDQEFSFDNQKMRTWTSGKHKVKAKLLEVQGDKIVLLKFDGKRKTVPLNLLSKRDQNFVSSLLREIQNEEDSDNFDQDIWGIEDDGSSEDATGGFFKDLKKEMKKNGFGEMADKFEDKIQEQIQEAERQHRANRKNRNQSKSFDQRSPLRQPQSQNQTLPSHNTLPGINGNISSGGGGKTITNQQFGFSVTIPSRFHAWNNAPVEIPDKLYLFEDSTTDNWNASDLVIIRRLRTKLNKLSMQIPPSMRHGANQTSETYVQWNGKQIKAFRILERTAEGDYLSFVVPFDLPKEAIQLIVGGPPEDEFRIKQTMRDVVNSFKQLNSGGSNVPTGADLIASSGADQPIQSTGLQALFSSPERMSRLAKGIGRLAGFILVCILIFTSLRGKLNNKKKHKRRY